MNDQNLNRYTRLTKVQTFGDDFAADTVAGSKADTLFLKVDAALKALDKAKAEQTPDRVSKKGLLDELRLDCKDIARTARTIELSVPGFAAPYRIPDSPAESVLTTHADGLLLLLEDQTTDSAASKTAKAALRAKFVEYEIPADFVADLRADRNAVKEANTHNQSENLDGVENTELIEQVLDSADDTVLELNTIMHNKYARQPEKLKAWHSASHLERPAKRKKSAPTPPAPKPPQ